MPKSSHGSSLSWSSLSSSSSVSSSKSNGSRSSSRWFFQHVLALPLIWALLFLAFCSWNANFLSQFSHAAQQMVQNQLLVATTTMTTTQQQQHQQQMSSISYRDDDTPAPQAATFGTTNSSSSSSRKELAGSNQDDAATATATANTYETTDMAIKEEGQAQALLRIGNGLHMHTAQEEEETEEQPQHQPKEAKEDDMDFARKTWYTTPQQRQEWFDQRGKGNQNELTQQMPNLNDIEIDNSISSSCDSIHSSSNRSLKVIGFNAERGRYWDLFANMVLKDDVNLINPHVIVLSEMDIGMARSGNVHTTRQLAIQLGMNYIFGIEFMELTRGTEEEQNRTSTTYSTDSLSLHGNAILTKCHIADPFLIRDTLPSTYFSHKANSVNAGGYEVRLGGRMALFVRIYQQPQPQHDKSSSSSSSSHRMSGKHFVVGSAHKLAETPENQAVIWNYLGFGTPPINFTLYRDLGTTTTSPQQAGVVVQGDFSRKLCPLMGLLNADSYKHRTFPAKCEPVIYNGQFRGDQFCTDMGVLEEDIVTSPCYKQQQPSNTNDNMITLSDHAIVSIVLDVTGSASSSEQ